LRHYSIQTTAIQAPPLNPGVFSMENRITGKDAGRMRGALCACGCAVALFLPYSLHAAEIIPSVGLTRSADGDQARGVVGLAVRAPLVKNLLDSEIGFSYRSQTYQGGALKVTSWPMTASAWLRFSSTLYAGGGIGWYNTTYHSPGGLYVNETHRETGVHLGGGIRLPMSPKAGLDLSGRYIFLSRNQDGLIPKNFNPDAWTTSLGLALQF
jgi:hypothetical protein